MSHNIYVNGVACTFKYLLFNNQTEADTWVSAKIQEVRGPIEEQISQMIEGADRNILGPAHFRTYLSNDNKCVVEIVYEVVWNYITEQDKTKLKTPQELIAMGFNQDDFIYHL